MGPWNHEKIQKIPKISNISKEKTIFFPLASNLTTRYVKIVMSRIYDDNGGLHYFSENPSYLTGTSYQGL